MTISLVIPHNVPALPFDQFEPIAGAAVVVDTKNAQLYIINPDGVFTSVPALLGQNRVVHYLGRTYKATTPEERWVVRSIHTQGDRITFGKDGTFLRLYKNGKERTAYGIHGHRYFQQMLAEGDPYRSLGCVLVADDVVKKVQKAYELNSKELTVVTVYGIDESTVDQLVESPPAPKQAISSKETERG